METVKNQELYPFIFDQIRLKEACWVNDEPFFTRRAIGEWLEYRYPQKKIDKIIERNPHINQFSTAVNLTAVEGTREVTREIRTYNPIGLQLIIFESRQPKAKAYKVMVAHLVYAFMRGELKPPRNIAAQQLYVQCKEALKLTPYYERPVAVKYLAEKHAKSLPTIYRWIKRIERGENPAETRLNHYEGRFYINEDTEAEIISLVKADPGVSIKDIVRRVARADCTAKATIYRIRRKVKEQIKQYVIKKLEGAV